MPIAKGTSSHALIPPAPRLGRSRGVPELKLDGLSRAELVNRRTRQQLQNDSAWYTEARTAQLYYRSQQYRRDKSRPDRNRIRLIANFIRRDIDMMVAEVLDGKPIVEPGGRRPKDYEVGRLLLEVLQWTRDEEENWDTDQERVITDLFHIGEGVLFEGWDQDADGGRGMPRSLWLDSRYVLWPQCKNMQRDDADWIIWLEHESIGNVLDLYPQLEGKIQPESFETFMTPAYASMLSGGRRMGMPSPVLNVGPGVPLEEQKVWIKRMWSKKKRREKTYFYEQDGEPAYVFDAEGKEVPLTAELYAQLPTHEQDTVVSTSHLVEELWETVIINNEEVEHRLSPFDQSKGGHGKYPFAFFSCVLLADETRARGEIGWLVNVQDIINETTTMMIDQLFMQNMGYFDVKRGSLNPEERQKLEDIPRRGFSIVETAQGVESPNWKGMNPGAPNLFVRALDTMSGIMDKISGIHEPSRGEIPGYVESGRAIRALQSRSSLLTTKTRRHIESGLRRSTLMRLYNIAQFMRGSRMAKVVDERSKEEKPIFIGSSELEIIMSNQLQPAQDKQGKKIWQTADGRTAHILVLNDHTVGDIVFEQVGLHLDTGVVADKMEKREEAQMVLQTVGPPAIPWAAAQLNWSNRDQLIADIERADEGRQLQGQLEQIEKETKIPKAELMDLLLQTVQQRLALQQAGTTGQSAGAALAVASRGGPPAGGPAPSAATAGPGGAPAVGSLGAPATAVTGIIPGQGGAGIGLAAA